MRHIDWNKPLSDDDKLWLEQRLTPGLQEKIDANQTKFGSDKSTDPEFEDNYDQWKVPELAEEATKREINITGVSKKPELIALLRTWDKEHPEDV